MTLASEETMSKRIPTTDPQSVFCEVCMKAVPKAGAVASEGRDHIAYFCSNTCYDQWRGPRAPEPASSLGIQEGAGRARSRDDRVKRQLRRHVRRDEPR